MRHILVDRTDGSVLIIIIHTILQEVVADKCRNKAYGFGYNAATDTYEDLLQTGVLDPAKVPPHRTVLHCTVRCTCAVRMLYVCTLHYVVV